MASVRNEMRWIMLPGVEGGGYSYGVEAKGKDWEQAELHGGFNTYAKALRYCEKLLVEYDGYAYAYVVKIETPKVATPLPKKGITK